jgi:hypothetical protein
MFFKNSLISISLQIIGHLFGSVYNLLFQVLIDRNDSIIESSDVGIVVTQLVMHVFECISELTVIKQLDALKTGIFCLLSFLVIGI